MPFDSVLPTLRELPLEAPRAPLLPGLLRRPFALWLAIFPVLAVIFGIGGFIFALNQKPTPARVAVAARVVQVERVQAGAGDPSTFVKYAFRTGNGDYPGNALLMFNAPVPRVGDAFRVDYPPGKPAESAPVSERVDPFGNAIFLAFLPLIFMVWVLMMMGIFAPFAPLQVRTWWQVRKLYRNGDLATGRVQFVRQSNRPGASGYEIVAEFEAEGRGHVVATRCDNAWLIHQLAPESEVVVAYDAKRPARAAILEPFAF